MKRILRIGAILALVVIVLTLALASVAFAADNGKGASYGESSEGAGPGLENCWGEKAEAGAGSGTCLGAGYGESSEGAGPGLENCFGKIAHAE